MMHNPETDAITVVIVEDHPIVLDALRGYIQAIDDDIVLIGEAATPGHALTLVEELVPDVVLFDLILKDSSPQDGLHLIDKIRQVSPGTRVIVLTGYQQYVFPAIRFGASTYLLKTNVQPHDVRKIIRQVHAGNAPLDPDVARQLWSYFENEWSDGDGAGPTLQRLTSRESQVLELLVQRKTNAQIAEELVISIKTVKTHISNMLAKLELSNREQLRMLAIASQPHVGATPEQG